MTYHLLGLAQSTGDVREDKVKTWLQKVQSTEGDTGEESMLRWKTKPNGGLVNWQEETLQEHLEIRKIKILALEKEMTDIKNSLEELSFRPKMAEEKEWT